MIRDKQEKKEREAIEVIEVARRAAEAPTIFEIVARIEVYITEMTSTKVTRIDLLVSSEPSTLGNEERQIVSALHSAVRPSASTLSKHKDNQTTSHKRSASEADRGKAASEGNVGKK